MLKLDMTTTVTIYVLVNYVCTFMIFLTWYQNKEKFSGLSYMLYDFLFQSIGMTLAAAYGLFPAFFTIGLANILMFTGATLFLLVWPCSCSFPSTNDSTCFIPLPFR